MNEQQVNEHIKAAQLDTNLISDGYHTFGELYEHRIQLWIALCLAKYSEGYATQVWRSKAHSDGSVWDGWFILGMFFDRGEQMTYHLPMSKWEECSFAPTLDKAPEWDGHSSADVLRRIALFL